VPWLSIENKPAFVQAKPRLPNSDAGFSFHFLFVVAALGSVMDEDGSSNAIAGPSTLPDAILSYLPPAGKSSHGV
jgi:hypothetical protein